MSKNVSIDEWNSQTVSLMQAMLGAVSPNFRMVTLSHNEGTWVLGFYIEVENIEDMEEIDDIAFEFGSLQVSNDSKYEWNTTITSDPLTWPDSSVRVVFKRREL